MIVDELGPFLLGSWRVTRTLHDLGSGAVGSFEGTAVFSRREDGMIGHREHGLLAWGGRGGEAERSWDLVATDDPGVWDVRFDDGRPFHRLDLRTGRWATEHRCAPDLYVGDFEVEAPDAWRYTWQVSGPRKSLELASRLTRARAR